MAETTKTPIDKGKIRVFVYGTLKKNHGNHVLMKMANAIFVGYDTVTGPYRMYDMGAFPAIIDRITIDPAPMHGEIWALDPEGLASLDLLEGNPHFYARRKMWTDNHKKRVWVYFLNSAWAKEALPEDELPNNIWEPFDEEKEHWGLQ